MAIGRPLAEELGNNQRAEEVRIRLQPPLSDVDRVHAPSTGCVGELPHPAWPTAQEGQVRRLLPHGVLEQDVSPHE